MPYRRTGEVQEGDTIIRVEFMEKPRRYSITPAPLIRYREEERRVETGFGTRIEGTGHFIKGQLEVSADGAAVRIEAKADALKGAVRRVREREAAEIAAIDAELEALRQRHIELTAQRHEVLARAFRNGHVFTLAEAKQIADEHLARKTQS